MKTTKLAILLTIILVTVALLNARMIYEPASDMLYCSSLKINRDEYVQLLAQCVQIKMNMTQAAQKEPSFKSFIKQVSKFLKGIKTHTAKQLLKDLKENKIYYPDGSICRRIYG